MSPAARCVRCSAEFFPGTPACPACGHPVDPSAPPTVHLPEPLEAIRPDTDRRRFLPGNVVAGRYRIVGLVGRGGMGEVYRADDLKLGMPVALKFLPEAFESDPDRLRRFLNEVRTARQISHPNVCRIHDVGEAGGRHFLSMEFVDGEDLKSLLRRIGRIPSEKAIQIARQLCAGLSASHEMGVLHRDLKPANIMIDGRGHARITDFGLAGSADDIRGEELRSGTPAYMAPEQFEGREVSVRSDLYSLGLVLHEMFTGGSHAASAPAAASSPSRTADLDPVVERVVRRCLEPDPARRPPSALAVAASLPGGDPLAAALAAGETPSPEMVADAADSQAAPSIVSWGTLAAFGAALLACIALAPRTALTAATRLELPPAVLEVRAKEILAGAGYAERAADSQSGFIVHSRYLDDLRRRIESGASGPTLLRSAPPSGLSFVHRRSPSPLVRRAAAALGEWAEDPPTNLPGMIRVDLDPDGRLIGFLAVPGDGLAASAVPDAPDWESLVRATGVEPGSLVPVPPEWTPPVYADHRAAWTAHWPSRPDLLLRVEAASVEGRPVWLEVGGPWRRSGAPDASGESLVVRAGAVVGAVFFVLVAVVAGLVALRNVRRGRGDRRGAIRLALYLGAIRLAWLLGAHHVPTSDELEILIGHLSYALQRVGLAYVFYLAVEPYCRRLWPRMLSTWVRVLDGRFGDPLVGRDLLVGCAAGAASILVERVATLLTESFGGSAGLPRTVVWDVEALGGPASVLLAFLASHTLELLSVIFPITLLLILRLLLRRTVPAVVVLSALAAPMFYPGSGSIAGFLAGYAVQCTILFAVLLRVGLLGFATTLTIAAWIRTMPGHPGQAPWLTGSSALALACVAAPAVWGFVTSRAGRPFFRDSILEPEAR